LLYTIVGNTNASLFNALAIDANAGVLTLTYATNVIGAPAVSVITPVDYDHKEFLGEVHPAPGIRVGYFAQEPELGSAKTVQEAVNESVEDIRGRRVEQLYGLLEQHGDERMREAIAKAVERGQLSVGGVQRRLPTSARGREGVRPRVRAAQPRGRSRGQLPLPLGRAGMKRGEP